MKANSVKFWIVHKLLKFGWKCLISSSVVWKQYSLPSRKKKLTRKRVKFNFRRTIFQAFCVRFRTMWIGGYRWRKCVINCKNFLFSLFSWCWSRFSRSKVSMSVQNQTISCFEVWISNGWFHFLSTSGTAAGAPLPFPSPVCYASHWTSHVVVSFTPCLFLNSRHLVPRSESFPEFVAPKGDKNWRG